MKSKVNNVLAVLFVVGIIAFILRTEITRYNSAKVYTIAIIDSVSTTYTGKMKLYYSFVYKSKVESAFTNQFVDDLRRGIKPLDLIGKPCILEICVDDPGLRSLIYDKLLPAERAVDLGKVWPTYKEALGNSENVSVKK